jgi:hypothetical protein
MNLGDVLGDCNQARLEIHLDAKIELNSAMNLQAVIEWVWSSTSRPGWGDYEMLLEAEIELNSEKHLEVMIERVWRCIWWPRSCNSELLLEAERS